MKEGIKERKFVLTDTNGKRLNKLRSEIGPLIQLLASHLCRCQQLFLCSDEDGKQKTVGCQVIERRGITEVKQALHFQ